MPSQDIPCQIYRIPTHTESYTPRCIDIKSSLINLIIIFKNNGHCITMDSAYMGNITTMTGRNVLHVNMVGTAQGNRIGANINCTKLMKKGAYNSICLQHAW